MKVLARLRYLCKLGATPDIFFRTVFYFWSNIECGEQSMFKCRNMNHELPCKTNRLCFRVDHFELTNSELTMFRVWGNMYEKKKKKKKKKKKRKFYVMQLLFTQD